MLFIKSVVMGLSIAVPVGPIGMLCIQRSLSRGFQAGFATGVGAACADAIYGLLGALGIAGIVTAFPMLTVGLKIGGGAFLVWLAWTIAPGAGRVDGAARPAAHDRPARFCDDVRPDAVEPDDDPVVRRDFRGARPAVGRAGRGGVAGRGADGRRCVHRFRDVVAYA